jgi:hypothetical protein
MGPVVAATIIALLWRVEHSTQIERRPDAAQPLSVVVGCVHGSELKLTKPGVFRTYADTVRLRGPKKALKALREHEDTKKK